MHIISLVEIASKRLNRLFANERGTAAIEFALIVPVLATIVVLLPDASAVATGAMDMNMAVRSTVQYAMNGGTDMNAAKAIGNQNWTSKPNGATLTATQACVCSGAAGACGQICQDGTQPQTYVTVTGSGTFGGSTISLPLTFTQTVRTR